MAKITASKRVIQPVGIRGQPPRTADGCHRRGGAVSLSNFILRRSLLVGTLPQNPVDGRPADLECLGDVAGPHALNLQFADPRSFY
jgi:hypothetical protein